MKIVYLIVPLLVAPPASGAPNRRDFMGLLGGAVTLTGPAPQNAAPAAESAAVTALSTLTRARGKRLRLDHASHEWLNSLSPHEWRERRGTNKPPSLEREFRLSDVDVLRDWSLNTPEGRALAPQVEKLIALLELDATFPRTEDYPETTRPEDLPRGGFQSREGFSKLSRSDVDRILFDRLLASARLQDVIHPALRAEPWVSLDWFEVFGTRLALVELELHHRTGLDFFEAQQLVKLVLGSMGNSSLTQQFFERVCDSDEMTNYTVENLHVIIEAVSTFAPLLARMIETFHLDFERWSFLRYTVRLNASFIGWFNLIERRNRLNPALFHSGTWQQSSEIPGNGWAHYRTDALTESLLPKERVLDDRARHLDAQLTRVLEFQRGRIEEFEQLPSTPITRAILGHLRDFNRQTEFERATIPQRMQAQAILELVHAELDANPSFEPWSIVDAIPPADSRKWLHWKPTAQMLRVPEPERRPELTSALARLLDFSPQFHLWSATWLDHLLQTEVPISPETLKLVRTPAPDPADEPRAIEHASVICSKSLETLEPVEIEKDP